MMIMMSTDNYVETFAKNFQIYSAYVKDSMLLSTVYRTLIIFTIVLFFIAIAEIIYTKRKSKQDSESKETIPEPETYKEIIYDLEFTFNRIKSLYRKLKTDSFNINPLKIKGRNKVFPMLDQFYNIITNFSKLWKLLEVNSDEVQKQKIAITYTSIFDSIYKLFENDYVLNLFKNYSNQKEKIKEIEALLKECNDNILRNIEQVKEEEDTKKSFDMRTLKTTLNSQIQEGIEEFKNR